MRIDELVELTLLASGTLLLIVAAAYLYSRREWGRTLAIPPLDGPPLLPIDAAVCLLLFVTTGSFLASLLNALMPAATEASPPVEAVPAVSPRMIAINAAAQLINIFVVVAVVRARLSPRFDAWGLSTRNFLRQLGGAVVIYIAVWPICTALVHLSAYALTSFGLEELPEHGAIRTLLDTDTPAWIRALTIFSAIILAPVIEELIFRGVLFRAIAQASSFWPAAFISGLAFGLIHYAVPHTILPLFVFGVVLAYVYARSGSLTLVILIHAVFNAKTIASIMLGARPGS